jgi:hypothetical protein
MATLIPSLGSCKRRMTTGERRFAERLETKLEDDYLIWYDVPVGRAARHPDFIVLNPRRGILILEVKDWPTDTIQSVDKTRATLLTERGIVHEVNPFEQARQFAHDVVARLQRDPALVKAEDEHRGKLAFPWSYGVVLPFITRRQFEEAELGQVLLEDRVICSDEIYENVYPEEFQRRLWTMFPWQSRTPLTLPQIERIRWHIFPEIRIAQPRQQELLDDAAPDMIRIMDVQQEQLARSLGEGHRVIHGVAGSGKTMILAYRCIHLAKVARKPILVLCYNKTLAARLNHLITERGVTARVNVRNFHAWCRAQLDLYHVPLPTTNDRNEYARELVERLVTAVDRGQVPRAQYEAVLIDEGHDFEPAWLQLVVQMIDPETESLLLLYDDAQSIYGARRKFSFKSVGVQAQGRTTILRLNYRNTAEVLRVAYDFAKDVLRPEEADDDGVPLVAPESAERHGPRPELVRLPSLSAEGGYLAKRLFELHKQGENWGDMAVVYRSGFVQEEISEQLGRLGIPTSLLTKPEARQASSKDDRVKLVTFHSSKGLEYPIVAIPGFGFLPDPREDEVNELRLAYVAMTRAMDRLIMTCHRRTPFVDRLRMAGALWSEPTELVRV